MTAPDENEGPRIAVLLATYNGGRWVEEQIRSILRQEGVRVHLLVGDDASSDNTVDVVRPLLRPGDVLLPPRERLGSPAQNFFRLLQHTDLAKFDFAALSDQDDLWQPDHLRRGVEQLRKQGAEGYSSDVEAFWGDGRRQLIKKSEPQKKWDHLFEGGGPGCTQILTRRLATELQATLAFEGHGTLHRLVGDCHDWFIYSFTRRSGYRWHIDNYPGVRYRQHQGNVMGVNSGWPALTTRWSRLRNGWYRNRVLAVADLCRVQDPWPIVRMRRLSAWDRVVLGLNVFSFRRRFRDCVILMAALITSGMKGGSNEHKFTESRVPIDKSH
jgi:rhamnosyltransferase